MPDIFSTINLKGGVGKTTTTVALAEFMSGRLGKRVLVIDLDPQASAKGWHDRRTHEVPVVISAHASRLAEVIETARAHGAHFCIIDTAPHSETTALAAAKVADLVLIPCRPAVFDLRAISTSADLTQIAGRPALIVINAAPPRGPLADQAAEAITTYGIPVASARVTQRVAFVHSLTRGQTVLEYEPNGAAAREIRNLFMMLCKHEIMIT